MQLPHRIATAAAQARGGLSTTRGRLVAVALVLLVVGGSAAWAWWAFGEPEVEFIAFDYQRAYEDIEALTANGPRFAGGEGERLGAEYVAAQFTAAGLSRVTIHSIPWTLYEPDGAQAVTIAREERDPVLGVTIDRDEQQLSHLDDFTVLAFSGSLDDSDIEAVFVGNGDDANYSAAGAVSGRAVLVANDGAFSYSELYLQALDHGAVVSLIYDLGRNWPIGKASYGTDARGHSVPFPEAYPEYADSLIPHLMLSETAGEELRGWIEEAEGDDDEVALVDLDISVTIEPRETRVVTGDIIGESSQIVMLGAHMDTHYVGDGAVDNTVGTAEVIEMARQFAQAGELEYTVRFATWGGEELGLLGSYGYFLQNEAALQGNLRLYLNFDMTHADLGESGDRIPFEVNDPELKVEIEEVMQLWRERFPALAADYQTPVSYSAEAGPSDHRTFAMEGFTTATGYGSGSAEYHTKYDTIEQINAESLQIAPQILGSYGLHVARYGL